MRSEQRKRRRHQRRRRRWHADKASPSATHVSAHHVCFLATLPTVQCPNVPLSVWSPLVAFEIRMRQRFCCCFSFHLSMLSLLCFPLFPLLPHLSSSSPSSLSFPSSALMPFILPSAHNFRISFSCLFVAADFTNFRSDCLAVCVRVCVAVCVPCLSLHFAQFMLFFAQLPRPSVPLPAPAPDPVSASVSAQFPALNVSQSRLDVCYVCTYIT